MDDPNKNNRNTDDPRFGHLDIDTVNAASSTDFTGLIPANPQFIDELDAYEDIYGFNSTLL